MLDQTIEFMTDGDTKREGKLPIGSQATVDIALRMAPTSPFKWSSRPPQAGKRSEL